MMTFLAASIRVGPRAACFYSSFFCREEMLTNGSSAHHVTRPENRACVFGSTAACKMRAPLEIQIFAMRRRRRKDTEVETGVRHPVFPRQRPARIGGL